MKRSECRRARAEAGPPRASRTRRATRKNMVPLYDPGAGRDGGRRARVHRPVRVPRHPLRVPGGPRDARARRRSSARPIGKRLCDAHEWEGACAGALHAPEVGVRVRRAAALRDLAPQPATARCVWAYGPKKDHALCATGTPQDPGLHGRRLDAVRLEHLPGRRVPRVREPASASTTSTATRPST